MGGKKGNKKENNPWLEAFRRARKSMPPPTKVKPGKKGKGVPYHREREDLRKQDESE